MMEMISENKYRISIIIMILLFFLGLGYLFLIANTNLSIGQILTNWINYILLISFVFFT